MAQVKRQEQRRGTAVEHGHGGAAAQRRPRRLTRSLSAAESGDGHAAALELAAAAGSAAALPGDEADALSSSSGEFVEIKARRHAGGAVNGSSTRAVGNGVAQVSIGGDAVPNGLKRRRSARLNGSQEDDAAQDVRTENGQEHAQAANRKRSRTEVGASPAHAAISLHDSGSAIEASASQSVTDEPDASRGDSDYAPGSPGAQSPEAVTNGVGGTRRRGRSLKAVRPSQQRGGGAGAGQGPSPSSAIPSTHVACPICARSVPKVPDRLFSREWRVADLHLGLSTRVCAEIGRGSAADCLAASCMNTLIPTTATTQPVSQS